MRAWNSQFERIIWREIGPRYGFPEVALEQWVCTAAEAAAMSLPRKLEDCAAVVGSSHLKDNKGYQNMLRMCRPRSKAGEPIVWWTAPERLQNLYEYCKQDVRTERSLLKSLRRLTPREREIYLLDQRINDRGIMIDRPLVVAAKALVSEGAERAGQALEELTDGAVTKVTQNGRLLKWVQAQGVDTMSLGKASVAELMEDEGLEAKVRAALDARSESGKSSVAKLDSMLAVAGPDDRLHGLLLYHGAGTGRWSGMKVQPQNFPRGEFKDIEDYTPNVLSGDYDSLDVFAPPVMLISSMLRSMLVAAPGYDFAAADYSAIECRVLNWLAGQDDVLESFREYDKGDKSRDPYKIMAVKMGRAPNVDLVDFIGRQAGKAAELGCGFQMGSKKFVSAAWNVYQLRVNQDEADTAVKVYRSTHPHVVQLWADANEAALQAVMNPGSVRRFGARSNLSFTCRGSYLYLILPSKRPLCYASPKVVERITPWGATQLAVEVSGTDSYTHQWGRYQMYGGIIIENAVQAVARDLLAEAMLRVDPMGYPVVLTAHDELVSEPRQGFGSVAELEALMEQLPPWAFGCPVKAEGWRGKRYRK